MSCLGPSYNPVPAREWYRVHNACSLTFSPPNPNANANANTAGADVFVPLYGKSVPASQVGATVQLIAKGNVLQYKANSAQLSKAQIFSLIAQNKWTNRSITYASQTQTVTNPNVQNLKCIGGGTILLPGRSPYPSNQYTQLPTTGSPIQPPSPPI